MSGFKYTIAIVLLALAASCNFGKHTFSFSEQDMSPGFFEGIPAVAYNMIPSFNLDVSKVHVYKARFKVQREMNENVLDYTVVPVSGSMGRDSFGFLLTKFEDLYLLQLETTPSKKAYIYFSAKYLPAGFGPNVTTTRCLGFGPGYFGYYDSDINRIHFTRRLKVDRDKERFTLKTAGKRNFSFIADSINNLKNIRVSKILIEDPNKIGGMKNTRYTFKEIYDFDHINFQYITTINVK